jgi:predicted nucleic acid-binding protein
VTAYIVDASVAVKWVVPQPDSETAHLLRGKRLSAPDILLAEAGNALWVYVRARALSKQEALLCFATLRTVPLQWLDLHDLAPEAMTLSIDLGHPFYDCVYLAAALVMEVPLVTADRRLIKAARSSPEIGKHLVPLSEVAV